MTILRMHIILARYDRRMFSEWLVNCAKTSKSTMYDTQLILYGRELKGESIHVFPTATSHEHMYLLEDRKGGSAYPSGGESLLVS